MARGSHFVCQHLEKISRGALEKHQAIIRDYVRRRQGIYALYSHEKLYYVGLASNLRSRLTIHLKDRHRDSWDRFSIYLTIGDSHLRELEALLLRVVKPKGNKQTGKLPRSEDLRRRFSRDVRAELLQQLVEIIGKKPALKASKVPKKKPEGRQPTLAAHIKAPMKLRARHKGKLLHAQVRRDGTIRFNGQLYTSPSDAGAAACQRPTCNGWTFWEYERASGDWVLIDELRK
jgi:hypothetical protein